MVDFLVIGNMNVGLYLNVSRLFIDDTINVGYNMVSDFEDEKKAAAYWYTTFDIQKEPIELKCVYDKDRYYRYINYDAINVDNINDIPYDYNGVVGVPITFLFKYDKRQFEIVSFTITRNDKITIKKEDVVTKELKGMNSNWRLCHPVILKDDEYVYLYYRILIKRK